jgi:hypothetical protein
LVEGGVWAVGVRAVGVRVGVKCTVERGRLVFEETETGGVTGGERG